MAPRVVADQPDVDAGEPVDRLHHRGARPAHEGTQGLRVGADHGLGAELGVVQGDDLLVQRAHALGPVDHAYAGRLGQVEQVRRVQVARVDRRVDPQLHDGHLVRDVEGRRAQLVPPLGLDDPAVVARRGAPDGAAAASPRP